MRLKATRRGSRGPLPMVLIDEDQMFTETYNHALEAVDLEVLARMLPSWAAESGASER